MHSKLIFLLAIFFFILPIVTMAIPVPHEEDAHKVKNHEEKDDGLFTGIISANHDHVPIASPPDNSKEYSQKTFATQQQSNGNKGIANGNNLSFQPDTEVNACNIQAGLVNAQVPIGTKCKNSKK
ncbi:hypothetical protein C2G38_606924 [Gigaspora rosea]|uniref:Uncharacterized protein n=1 Tax=Gigaspora rosea TaxID=44941 RepID=A0A397W0G7_9GLOM|nr:hypothetical protein C2G38_606924 [Gigaspora rosea]